VDGLHDPRLSFSQLFSLNLRLLYRALENEQIHRPLTFFIMMGLVIPTYDNIHYYFLLNTCGMSPSEYDLLSILNFVGIVVGTIIYLKFLRKVEVWKLIFTSLVIRVILTVATLINVLRINLRWGITDMQYNMVIIFFNHANVVCLAVLPMTVLMTYVIPKNIEASMFALLTAAL
jgi:hypothetical protein